MKSHVMFQVICVATIFCVCVCVCVFSRISVPKVVFVSLTKFLVDSINIFLPRVKPMTASKRSIYCVVMVFIHYYDAANVTAKASGPEALQRCSPAWLAQRRIGQPEALCFWQ